MSAIINRGFSFQQGKPLSFFLRTLRHDAGIVPYGFVSLSYLVVGCDDHIAPRSQQKPSKASP